MARKKTPSSETERDDFPLRLTGLMKEKPKTSQQALADAIGVTRQAVSNYMLGQSSPDWKTMVKIADYFSVSADYLLGRSNTKSVDADLQAVTKYTGLSETVIDWLHSIKCDPTRLETLETLSVILGNKTFQALLPFVNELKNVQIAAEIDRWNDDADYVPTREIGNGKYVVGGYEYLSVLEYRIAEYFKMVIDDITLKSLDDLGG